MRGVGAVRSSWSLLSKTAPVSQLGGAVWSAARRFSPKVSPKVTAFEFAVSRPSLVARLIPVVSSQTDGNTRDHDWPWKPVIVIAAAAAVLEHSITYAEPDEESGDEQDGSDCDVDTSDRDRRALLRSDPPAGRSLLEWGVELVTKHAFPQKSVYEYHDVARATLQR